MLSVYVFLQPLFCILSFTASVGSLWQPPKDLLDFHVLFLLHSSQCHQITGLKVTNVIRPYLCLLLVAFKIQRNRFDVWQN